MVQWNNIAFSIGYAYRLSTLFRLPTRNASTPSYLERTRKMDKAARIARAEDILRDDYPVYLTYWYTVDGVPKRSPLKGTALDLQRYYKTHDVRRCAAVERGLFK